MKTLNNCCQKEAALRSQAMILAHDLKPLCKQRFELTQEIEAIRQRLTECEDAANAIKRERLMKASLDAPTQRVATPKARKSMMVKEVAALLGEAPAEVIRIFKLQ